MNSKFILRLLIKIYRNYRFLFFSDRFTKLQIYESHPHPSKAGQLFKCHRMHDFLARNVHRRCPGISTWSFTIYSHGQYCQSWTSVQMSPHDFPARRHVQRKSPLVYIWPFSIYSPSLIVSKFVYLHILTSWKLNRTITSTFGLEI